MSRWPRPPRAAPRPADGAPPARLGPDPRRPATLAGHLRRGRHRGHQLRGAGRQHRHPAGHRHRDRRGELPRRLRHPGAPQRQRLGEGASRGPGPLQLPLGHLRRTHTGTGRSGQGDPRRGGGRADRHGGVHLPGDPDRGRRLALAVPGRPDPAAVANHGDRSELDRHHPRPGGLLVPHGPQTHPAPRLGVEPRRTDTTSRDGLGRLGDDRRGEAVPVPVAAWEPVRERPCQPLRKGGAVGGWFVQFDLRPDHGRSAGVAGLSVPGPLADHLPAADRGRRPGGGGGTGRPRFGSLRGSLLHGRRRCRCAPG